MTLNEVNIIKNSVLDATEAYVDARLNSSDFVKTQIGVTSGTPTTGTDGKYRHTVVCNATAYTAGVTYTNVLSVGNIAFPSGSVVFLIAPNAQYSNQFILGKLDTSPCNIEGGSISIGVAPSGSPFSYYFNVDNAGNVNIYSGSIKLTYNSTVQDYNFKVDSNGINLGVTGTSTSNKSYNFTVSNAGVVTIKNGSINLTYNSTVQDYNFKVDSNGIKLGVTGTSTSNKAYNFVVASNGVVTIKNGSINLTYNNIVQDYNFKVDSDGIKLGVTGTSTANKAYNFVVTSNGLVTIKSGSILLGATTIGGNLGYNVNLNSSGLGLGYLGYSGGTPQYNFTVGSNGAVTIKSGSIDIGNGQFNVDINGNLTTKSLTANISGEIAGWTINYNGLSHGDDAWVEPNKISCGSHGTTLVKMQGGNDGFLSVEVNDYMDWIRIYYNSIEKLSSTGSDYVVWQSQINNSDKKLKTNIIDLDLKSAEQFINNLLPKQYEFIPNKDKNLVKGKRYGFIAQDIEKIIDNNFNIVYEDGEKYKHLNYDDIIAPLVKIVQNQQQEIDMLKNQLGV